MDALPGGYLRVAATDAVTLEPEGATSANLVLADGTDETLELEDGSVTLPTMAAPNRGAVRWLDEDGEELYATELEVVSAHYFTLDSLRSMDDADDFTDLTDQQLWDARQAATETFELNAKRCFVERLGQTETYSGGFCTLRDCDVHEITSPDGWELVSDCQARGPWGGATIKYRYGQRRVPTRVAQAVRQLAAYYLRPSVTPDRATGESTEVGFIRYTLAGRDGATGLPEVDAIIAQFGRRRYDI